MGSLCSHLDDTQNPKLCVKCKDYFTVKYGGLSQRTSCRFHNYVNEYIPKKGWVKYCKNCSKYDYEIKSRNCYHSMWY